MLPACQSGVDLTQVCAAADDAEEKFAGSVCADRFGERFRAAAEQYKTAADKMDQAFALVQKAKRNYVAQETDVSTAVAKANEALKAKHYPQAFSYYKQAADMGNVPAMFNVGRI